MSLPTDTASIRANFVQEIRRSDKPAEAIAEQYGISSRYVRKIRAGKVWRHLPKLT